MSPVVLQEQVAEDKDTLGFKPGFWMHPQHHICQQLH